MCCKYFEMNAGSSAGEAFAALHGKFVKTRKDAEGPESHEKMTISKAMAKVFAGQQQVGEQRAQTWRDGMRRAASETSGASAAVCGADGKTGQAGGI